MSAVETHRASLGVWFVRFLFCTLFANQFRRAPVAVFALLFWFLADYLPLEAAARSLWKSRRLTHLTAVEAIDLQIWAQTAFTAILAVGFIRYQLPWIRYLVRGACLILLVTCHSYWRQALPFLNLPSFWCLFGISFSYHYNITFRKLNFRPSSNIQAYREAILKLIRAFRALLEYGNAPSKKDIDQAVADVQADRALKSRSDRIERAQDRNPHHGDPGIIPDLPPRSLRYAFLEEHDLRVLEAIPNGENPQLEFRLRHTALTDIKGEYTALSYCWGSTMSLNPITIDGVQVPVTANLYEALRETLALGFKTFWVDAVCINQSDTSERNRQVLRMLAIFQQAREVVAWLGREDSDSRRVMERLRQMSQKSRYRIQPLAPSIEDLKTFTSREFWRRIWILQELAAPTQAFLVCCGVQASLESLRPLLDEMHNWDDIKNQNWPQLLEQLQLIENILEIRRRRANGLREPLGLLEALDKTKASNSTRTHDRVYGLLRLAGDWAEFVPEPDYSISEVEMCLKMTQTWISSRKSLDIILAAPRSGTTSNLPSWCPDYLNAGTAPFNDGMVKYLSGLADKHRLGVKGHLWKTTASSLATITQNVRFDWATRSLEVEAISAGVVNGIGPCERGDRAFQMLRVDTTQMSGRRQSQRQSSSSSLPLSHAESTYDALCRMLLIYEPKYSKLTKAPIVLGMLYHFLGAYDFYAAWKGGPSEEVHKWLKANENFRIHGRSLKGRAQNSAVRMSTNFVQSVLDFKAKTMMFWDYGHVAKAVADIIREGLPLFTTADSLGWAHPDVMLEDEVYLIAGCSLPVILRKARVGEGQAYQVVGHAYLDGYMDGKKWAENFNDQRVKIKIY